MNYFGGQRLETWRKGERVADNARAFPRRIRRIGSSESSEVGNAEGGAEAQRVLLD